MKISAEKFEKKKDVICNKTRNNVWKKKHEKMNGKNTRKNEWKKKHEKLLVIFSI